MYVYRLDSVEDEACREWVFMNVTSRRIQQTIVEWETSFVFVVPKSVS